VRRIHRSLGPFPLAREWIDATIHRRDPRGATSGRFPTARCFDSILAFRSPWVCVTEKLLSGNGKRGTNAATRCGGNACSNGEFQRGGFRYTPAHARGRSPDPLAVGQPCGRRAPGLRSRHPHHASRGTL